MKIPTSLDSHFINKHALGTPPQLIPTIPHMPLRRYLGAVSYIVSPGHSMQSPAVPDLRLPFPKDPVRGLAAGLAVLVTAVLVCPPGGSPGPIAPLACHTGSSNLCKEYPVRWMQKFTFLGPLALLCCLVVCRRSDSLPCPSLCMPRLVGTSCPSTRCFFPALFSQPG